MTDMHTTPSKSQYDQALKKDCVVLGGGCSGLGLAYALSQREHHLDCLILEARSQYTHDKTWCFWENKNTLWTNLASKSWSQWSFQSLNEQPIIHQSKQWRYYYLPAIRYYQHIQNILSPHRHVQLQMNQTVTQIQRLNTSEIQDKTYHWLITTQTGQRIQAKRIIDTRPNTRQTSTLYQCFFGVEIVAPMMENQTAQLMHDMHSDAYGFRFNYQLPIGKNHILFEHTRFSPRPVSQQQLEQECHQALRRRYPTLKLIPTTAQKTQIHDASENAQIIRKEWGCLPMGLTTHTNDKPAYDLGGIHAGALRSASGYGFRRIQKWANHTAHQLIEQLSSTNGQAKPIAYAYQPRWQQTMDHLFLHTLKNNPSRASEFFHKLATNCNPDGFVRFLNDEAHIRDLTQIIISLPSWPFIRQCLSLNGISA